MSLLLEFFEALIKAALPIGALSYGMTWWALRRGLVKQTDGVQALNNEIKALAKQKKKDKKNKDSKANKPSPRSDLLHEKWMTFGGGFYGLVALYTYGMVEFREISDLIRGLGGLGDFFRQLGPGIFIEFIIESVTNFVTAIAWPVYWMGGISTRHIWLWLLVAYGGYWAGIKLALHYRVRLAGDDARGNEDP